MEETKWKKRISKKSKNNILETQENFDNPSRDLNKMNEKINNVYDKKKGFSKLPILDVLTKNESLENITSIPLGDFDDLGKSQPISEPFTNLGERDFADIELEQELIKLGLKKPKDDNQEDKTERKKDPHCDSSVPDYVEGQLVRKIGEMDIWKIVSIKGNNATINKTDSDGNEINEDVKLDEIENAQVDITIIGKIPKYMYAGYLYGDYGIKKLAIYFSKLITNNEENEEDIRLIIEEIYRIVYILFISFITFNWFFVFFYKNKDGLVSEFPTINNFVDKLKDYSLLNFLLGLATFPITFIHNLFTSKNPESISIPNISKMITSNLLLFSLLFLIIFTNFTGLNKSVSLMSKGSGTFGYLITLLLVYSIINWTFEEPTESDKELHIILRFLRWLFKTLVTFSLYVPVCMFFNLYFTFYSLLPRLLYKESYKDISENILNQLFPPNEDVCEIDEECKTYFERLMISFKKVLRFLLENLNSVLILVTMFYSRKRYMNEIKNTNLKLFLNVFILVVLFLALGKVGISFFFK